MEYNIDIKRALKKWSPILNALNVTKEYIAEYAERHTMQESFPMIETSPRLHDINSNHGDIAQNLLPVSLKIMSKINLDGKKVRFEKMVNTIEMSEALSRDHIEDIKRQNGMDVVQRLEGLLIDKLTNHINDELEKGDTLVVDSICNSISLISEATWAPRMIISSKFKVINEDVDEESNFEQWDEHHTNDI